MRSYLFIITLNFLIPLWQTTLAQWMQLNLPDNDVRCLTIDGNLLFAGTHRGVFVSHNAGDSWTEMNNVLPVMYVSSLAVKDSIIFEGTEENGVFRSTDFGKSWQMVNNPLFIGYRIKSLSIIPKGNDSMNILAGALGGVYVSTDTGATWLQIDVFSTWGGPFLVLENADEQLIIFASIFYGGELGGSLIIRSSDYGLNWDYSSNGIPYYYSYISSIVADAQNRLFASVYFPSVYNYQWQIFSSSDFGVDWYPISSTLDSAITSMKATDISGIQAIFAGTENNGVILSTDEGLTWKQINDVSLEGSTVNTLEVFDQYIYAGTSTSGLWKRSLSEIVTSIKEDNINLLAEGYILEQNYPNPFNPSTTIRYSIPTTEFVTLKVYDVLGKEVSTLVNEEKATGNYEVKFNSGNLSSGIYFYSLKAGKFSGTKKLILMK